MDCAPVKAGAGYPWKPAPAIRLSMLLHAAAAASLIVVPGSWPWALGAVLANHLLLTLAVFWPRGRILGANLTRLPAAAAARREICLTFDDGPDPEVTPQVLDLLDRHRAKATFFCVGEKVAAHPGIVGDIARRGHGIENHSARHSAAFALYGPLRLKRELEAAQGTIARIAGQAPRYFRAPVGLRSPLLDPVLARCGLRYVSWTRRGFDMLHRDPESVLRRLTRSLAAGDILLMHDSARAPTRDGTPVALAVLPELLNRIRAQGLKCVTLSSAMANGSES